MAVTPYSAPTFGAPAVSGVMINPSNSAVLNPIIRGFYVGSTGNVKIRSPGGIDLEFINIPSGYFMPWCADKVYSTSTTASGIVGAL